MKTLAILFMVLGLFLLLGIGIMYLLGFAMSFDAPGSASSPAAWGMRVLMFLPFVFMIIALVLSWMAFSSGNYRRAVFISGAPLVLFVLFFLFLSITSYNSLHQYRKQMAQEAVDAKLYPEQRYIRQVEGGADTIIVFPSRLVAYRKYQGTPISWNGPLGDLDESRKVMTYKVSTDTKIAIAELDQFTDEHGRKFTDVYEVK